MTVPGSGYQQIVLFIFKYGMYAVSILHVVFSIFVVRQVNLMTKTLKLGFGVPVKLMAVVHLILSVIVLLLMFALL